MQIGSSNTSFKGRSQLIKDADVVCRAIRNNFPYISSSKAAYEANTSILAKSNIRNYLLKQNNLLKEFRDDRRYITKPFNFYKEVLYSTNKGQVATCFDLSVLTEMVLKMNGVKNCGKLALFTESGKSLNHCVSYVQLGTDKNKKNLIIDPWLQDVDFLPEMITKYKNVYSKYCKSDSSNIIKLVKKPDLQLCEEEIKVLQEKYPSLFLKLKNDRKLFALA